MVVVLVRSFFGAALPAVQVMMSVQAVAGWGSALYFVCWVTVGKWVLLTLFLAITLSAFETNYEKYSRGTTTGAGLAQPL